MMIKELEIYKKGLVRIELVISLGALPFFRLSVPNKTYCYGLFECISRALKDLADHEADETKEQYLKELTALRKIAIDGAYISYSELSKIEEYAKSPIKVFLNANAPISGSNTLSNINKPINTHVKNERLRLHSIAERLNSGI